MASLRQIRGRLRSIHSTKQIMRAMQLVSGSKLKRAQGKLVQARTVVKFLDELLHRVLAASPDLDHPLCKRHEEAPSAVVLFTSDAGLCGSYNTNLIQLAESHVQRDSPHRTRLIAIGKKGHRYFTKRGYPSSAAYLDLAGRPDAKAAETIGRAVMESFLSRRVGAVHVLYSQFFSSTVYRPTLRQWLPVEIPRSPDPQITGSDEEYIFEPSAQRVFDDLIPRWALATFQLIMLEAFTSEHSARMIAMKSATDNAEELLRALTRQRNRMRQASITKELSEIVGTAEALN
ncbi:MAG: ATP synthase F1 subunit gamma [Candidatus Omnitrophica bacterium]|nr:ATP synthase F1 subunit gamma [Candidatus Omnitrophota bacterium]